MPTFGSWTSSRNRASQVTHSTRAGIPADSFVQPQTITYPTFDGKQIPAFFYLAEECGEDRQADGDRDRARRTGIPERAYFSSVVQYFANRGYAVLSPNVRGSTGYGREYTHADDYKKRMDAIKDVAFAHEYLKKFGLCRSQEDCDHGRKLRRIHDAGAGHHESRPLGRGRRYRGHRQLDYILQEHRRVRRENRAAEYGDPDKDPEFMPPSRPSIT